MACGQGLLQDALAESLKSQPDFHVAGCFSSLDNALSLIRMTRVNVLLLSVIFGRQTAAEAIWRARSAGFRGGVLVISGAEEREPPGLPNGRAGVIPQGQSLTTLHRCIRAIASGRNILGATPCLPVEDKKAVLAQLTVREADVLFGVFQGRSNKVIGAELGISENTVKTFVQQLFRKTGASTRSQLVRTAIEGYWSAIKSGEPAGPAALAMAARAGRAG
jgi:DNA-binding NarL/FixJ family response regulator